MKLRLIVVAILLLPLSPVSAQQAQALSALRKAISEQLEGPLFLRSLAAIEVADASSGTVLFAQNESLLLRPASNAKLLTSAAAVLGLPQDFHFETRLAARDSAMRTLVCLGGGDPLFSEQDIQKLGEIAQRAGVNRIDTLLLDGFLFGDDYFGTGWMWDDEADPFMPYVSAFSINSNTVTIRAKKSTVSVTGYDVTCDPSSDVFQIYHIDDQKSGTSFRIERIPRSNEFRIQGKLRNGKSETEKFSIWRPQELVASLFLDELRRRGITGDSVVLRFEESPASLLPLGSVRRPLDEVLAVMNKESDNLCAEAVLRALSFGTGRKHTAVTANDGLSALTSILARNGITTDDIALRDGSGISFYNLVTAAALGKVLRAIAASSQYDRYRTSLAIAGVDGTLRGRMAGQPTSRYFRGKTGTVRGVSALSGYVQAPGGRLLTVVMLMQNFIGKPAPYREVQDRLVKLCIEYSASATQTR
ncbi:MAG: D-alanyl-D-alanine carboxypeptidase/D-alanyl-D-alanine-endopeptidase [Bacteroidetes bacterium]|nr:D-alanyl-D-alanine carboxypeptidase/D-alanyl-D-alanine-endopeptidase [Bacteroidota bacterium]